MGYLIMKKTRARKSHATVPLKELSNDRYLYSNIGVSFRWTLVPLNLTELMGSQQILFMLVGSESIISGSGFCKYCQTLQIIPDPTGSGSKTLLVRYGTYQIAR